MFEEPKQLELPLSPIYRTGLPKTTGFFWIRSTKTNGMIFEHISEIGKDSFGNLTFIIGDRVCSLSNLSKDLTYLAHWHYGPLPKPVLPEHENE